jgi:hypothetical protein
MTRKRLLLLVEGPGDAEAAPILLKRLLAECAAFGVVFLDPDPFQVRGFSTIFKDESGKSPRTAKEEFGTWRRLLQAAAKKRNLGGCILLFDGDSPVKVEGKPFCAMRAARRLAEETRKVGGGSLFSVAIVFAFTEFESWLIAGAKSLAGVRFSAGRGEFPEMIGEIPCDPESAPRGAKEWFRRVMKSGYSPTRDQAELTRLVDLDLIRQQGMRSFRRLECAIKELVSAIRSGEHAVTPTVKA